MNDFLAQLEQVEVAAIGMLKPFLQPLVEKMHDSGLINDSTSNGHNGPQSVAHNVGWLAHALSL